MNTLQEKNVGCPYCGELISVLIEFSGEEQQYIEDCHVCCQPINFRVWQDIDGESMVDITHENE